MYVHEKKKRRCSLKTKKGSGFSELLFNILIILCIIIVLFVFRKIAKEGITTPMDKKNCETAMFAAENLNLGIKGHFKERIDSLSGNCPSTGKILIEDDITTITNNRIDDNKVKTILGYAMLACSNMVRNHDPFGNYEGMTTYCMICDNIKFSPKFQKRAIKEEYQINYLWHWFTQNNIPIIESKTRTDMTYYEAITEEKPTEEIIKSFENENELVGGDKFSKPYVTLWHVEKHGKSAIATIAKTGTTAAIGVGMALIPGSKMAGKIGRKMFGSNFWSMFEHSRRTYTSKLLLGNAIIGTTKNVGSITAKYGTIGVAVKTTIGKDSWMISSILLMPWDYLDLEIRFEEQGGTTVDDVRLCERPVNY